MADWAGFSEAELRKVKKQATKGGAIKPIRKLQSSYDERESPAARGDVRLAAKAPTNNTRESAKPTKQTHNHKPDAMLQKDNIVIKTEPIDTDEVVVKTERVDDHEDEIATKIQDLDDKEALSRDLMSMEKFREQQKHIEEANKQKKALLSKTLTERKKAAQKESYKLEHIQKELAKLDTLLTADVQVIRGKIEEASREFMDAQKRFERAENEYVAAKMELHVRQDLKEQLTEHLYTIIHQNEVRKAKKLASLMSELEMQAGGDDEEDLSLPELPPLTSFQPTHVHSPLHPTENNTNHSAHSPASPNANSMSSDANAISPNAKSPDTSTETTKDIENANKTADSATKGDTTPNNLSDNISDKPNVNTGEVASDQKSDKTKTSESADADTKDATNSTSDNTTPKLPDTAENVADDSIGLKTGKSKEIDDEKSKSDVNSKDGTASNNNSTDSVKVIEAKTGHNDESTEYLEKKEIMKTKWDFDGSVS